MQTSHIPVLIVGAGPVGMVTAALLRQHGVAVRIIEKNNAPTPFSKAIGVHSRTLESMHALGLTEQLISQGHPLHAFRLNDNGNTIMQAKFTGIGSAYEFVLGLPQSRTERTLLNRLQSLGGEVEWQTELAGIESLGEYGNAGTPAQVRLQQANGNEEVVTCNWLIGADGSRSAVRQFAGIEFPGGDYGKAFILGDVRIAWDGPKHELQFFLSDHGYMLLVPLPDGMHRIIAQTDKSYDDFQGSDRPIATLQDLQDIVDRNGPGHIRVHSPQWLTCAPFYHRCAETPLRGRTLLVGDAFHLFSPLGAQGLNTGFQDAFNLAWKLAYIEKGWAPARLVESYQQEREAIAALIAKVTSKTTRYITALAWHQRFLRRHITKWFNASDRVQRTLPRLLAGLMQAYDSTGSLGGHSAAGLPAAGQRVPHAWIPNAAGYQPLASLIHGSQFTLLLAKDRLDNTAQMQLEKLCTAHLTQLPFLRVVVVTREAAPWQAQLPANITLLEDRLGSVFDALNNPVQAALLVRPDGFVASSSANWAWSEIAIYFSHISMHANTPPATFTDTTEQREVEHAL